jgi:hypothetical protein
MNWQQLKHFMISNFLKETTHTPTHTCKHTLAHKMPTQTINPLHESQKLNIRVRKVTFNRRFPKPNFYQRLLKYR